MTRRHRPPAVAMLAVLLSLMACAPAFNPSGPCSTDGTARGAYPDLEAAVPTTFRSAPPKELNSGRTCTASALGTLAGHGVSELRFAGGTWETGTSSGLSLAVLTSPNGALDAAWVAEFYEASARSGKKVESVTSDSYEVAAGLTGRRLDVLNDESFQTVVVWPRDGRVAVAVVANFIRSIQTHEAHDAVVREAVAAFSP